MMKIFALSVFATLAAAFSAPAAKTVPAAAVPAVKSLPSIVEAAVGAPQLSTLVSVLTDPKYADILTALSGDGPFTVFAPTNDAFAAIAGTVATLTPDQVKEVLTYHVVAGAVPSSALAPEQSVPTLNGQDVEIKKSAAGVTVNNAKVVAADIMASNGVVHVIDKVLIPNLAAAEPIAAAVPAANSLPSIVEAAVGAPQLSTLVSVLTDPKYADILAALSGDGPFTVFAPTNDAFAAIAPTVASLTTDQVKKVLTYHVVSGAVPSSALAAEQSVATLNGQNLEIKKSAAGVTVNNAKVVAADLMASNGVVHIIDNVLVPAL